MHLLQTKCRRKIQVSPPFRSFDSSLPNKPFTLDLILFFFPLSLSLRKMTSMLPSNPTYKKNLLHESISYESACEAERNILLELSYPSKRVEFFLELFQKKEEIKQLVSHHLGLKPHQLCQIGGFSEWKHGSFNVCIPVYISKWNRRPKNRVMIRFPLPYKLGESSNPGNMDEKVRSEAATYVWMKQNCPEIPIPHLWGFGFGGDLHVCPRLSHCYLCERVC